MENVSPIELLAQAADDVGEAFESFMRTAFMNVMLEEVAQLCGPAYHPRPDAACGRAGSAPGRYFFGTDEEAVRKPRPT